MGDISLEELSRELAEFKVDVNDFEITNKCIGTGGYGKVMFGIQKATGRECAIKELRDETMSEKHMQFYCREVKICSLCEHPFILPFVGFTDHYPYTVITEFMPNGSLSDALHKKHSLSPTQKTQIAFGIAAGMERLHKLHVIHRDLKSQNILLDSLLLPKVADFGASQMHMDSGEIMTSGIGTLNWMAPELFETNGYTNKVDVYSFGLLLWEMETELVPFQGLQQAQVMNAVLIRQERPTIPANCNQQLANLMRSCWQAAPDVRPNFSQIVNLFKTKQVYFDGADLSAIDTLVEYYVKQMQQQTHSLRGILISKSATDIDSAFHKLTPKTAADAFKVTSAVLPMKSVTPSIILASLLRLFIDRPDLIDPFLEDRICMELPYDDPDIGGLALSVLIPIFQKRKEKVSDGLLELLAKLIPVQPMKILRLFSEYLSDFDSVEHRWFVGDILIMRRELFFAGNAAAPLMQILYKLLATSRQFMEGRLEYCIDAFIEGLSLLDEIAVHAAFSALIALNQPTFNRNMTQIITNRLSGSSHQLRDDALMLLCYTTPGPVTQELINAIIVHLNSTDLAPNALLNLMSSEEACCIVKQNHRKWLDLCNPENTLKILLRMMPFSSLEVREIPRLANYFADAACTKNVQFLMNIRSTIRRLEPTPSFVKELSKAGFIKNFLLSAKKINTDEMYHSCFLLIDSLIRICFVPDFLDFLDDAAEFLQTRPKLIQDILTILLIMANDRQALLKMKQLEIPEKLEQVEIPEQLQGFFAQFKKLLAK